MPKAGQAKDERLKTKEAQVEKPAASDDAKVAPARKSAKTAAKKSSKKA